MVQIGEQLSDLSDRKLDWVAQLGVEKIVANTTKDTGIVNDDGSWNVQPIKDLQRRVESHGLSMEVLNLGIEASYYERQRFPDLWAGGPGRDAAIATIQQNIQAAGEAGVPTLKYNCNIIGILRTGPPAQRSGKRWRS